MNWATFKNYISWKPRKWKCDSNYEFTKANTKVFFYNNNQKFAQFILGYARPCPFKKRSAPVLSSSDVVQTQQTWASLGGTTLYSEPWYEEPARFLKKPLSLLITAALCRQGGHLWNFMHSHFWWSSSPLSLSVVLKWQHHYCLCEHSSDKASFPPAWWNGSYKDALAVVAMIALFCWVWA